MQTDEGIDDLLLTTARQLLKRNKKIEDTRKIVAELNKCLDELSTMGVNAEISEFELRNFKDHHPVKHVVVKYTMSA